MKCIICYNDPCFCKFIHKNQFTHRDDPAKLPMRTTLCGGFTHFKNVHSYLTKITCPECIAKIQKKNARKRSYETRKMVKEIYAKPIVNSPYVH